MILQMLLMLLLMPFLLEGTVEWTRTAPGGFSAQAQFSAKDLTVEDLLKVELKLTYPDAYHVDVERLQVNLLRHNPLHDAPFSLAVPVSEQHTNVSDHRMEQTIVFTLQPQLPGNFSLTFYEMQFIPNSSQDKPVDIISDIVDVTIAKPASDELLLVKPRPLLTLSPALPIEISADNTQNILENKDRAQAAAHYNQETMQQSTLPWLEILMVLLVATLLVAMRYAPKIFEKPEETPSQRLARLRKESLKKLEALHQEELLVKRLYIPFYLGVANTVRHYVDEKYRLNIATRTTQEFLQQIETNPVLDPAMQKRLEQFFLQADLVKFAKEPPTLEECQAAEQIAREAMSDE